MRAYLVAAALAASLAGCGGPLVESTALPFAVDGQKYWPDPAHPQAVAAYYALPRATAQLEVGVDNCVIKVSIGNPTFVADPRYRYALVYTPLGTSDDTFSAEVDSSGLLAGVNTTAESKASDIAVAAIQLAGAVDQLARLSVELAAPEAQPDCKARSVNVVQQFDLSSDDDLQRAAARIQDELNGVGANIFAKAWRKTRPSPDTAPNAVDIVAPECMPSHGSDALLIPRRSGICYRPAATFAVNIKVKVGDSVVARHFEVAAPDPDLILYIPINRKVFSKYDVKLTFDHGMLKKFDSNDKSEVLAALQLPSAVIKAILGFPSAGK